MAFDAGTIEAHLTLDRTRFSRELNLAKQEGKAFDGTTYKAKLDLDRTTFNRDLEKTQRQLAELTARTRAVRLGLDSRTANAELTRFNERLLALGSGEVDVNADTTAASARLREVAAAARSVPREVDVKVDVDRGGAGRAALHSLIGLLIAGSPALVPAVAAATAGVVGLSSGLAAAGGVVGAAGVGYLAVGKQAAVMAEGLSKAKEKLDQTAEGTEAHAEALKNYKALLAEMKGPLGDLVLELEATKAAFSDLGEQLTPRAARTMTQALVLVRDVMTGIPPLFNVADRSISQMLDSLSEWFHGPGFGDLTRFITQEGPDAFRSFGRIAGGALTGVGHLFEAFAGTGQAALDWLADSMERFSSWADRLKYSPAFANFLDYVNENAPRVIDLIGSLVSAVIDVGQALAPYGGAALEAITGIARGLSSMAENHGDLLALGLVLGGLALAATKGTTALRGLTGALGAGSAAAKLMGGSMTGAVAGIVAVGIAAEVSSNQWDKWQNKKILDSGAKVNIDELSASLRTLGQTGEVTGAGLATLGEFGPVSHKFKEDAADSAAAWENLVDSFARGAGQDFGDKFKRLGDGGKNMAELTARTRELDAALSQLVQGGYAADARAAFDRIGAAAREAGVSQDDLNKMFPTYIDAVGRLKTSQDNATAGLDDTTDAALRQKQALDDLADAQNRASGALTLRGSARDLEAAYDDATASIKENGRTLDDNTPKGRANASALDAIAAAALRQAEAMRNAGKDQQDIGAAMADARERLIQVARGFNMSQTAAENYADSVLEIPPSVTTTPKFEDQTAREKKATLEAEYRALAKMDPTSKAFLETAGALAKHEALARKLGILDKYIASPKVEAQTEAANERIRNVNNRLDELGGRRPRPKVEVTETGVWAVQQRINAIRGKTVHINVVQSVSGMNRRINDRGFAAGGIVAKLAAGGVVRADTGMVVPGYAPGVDSVPAMLSPGEGVLRPEVVRALGAATINAWNRAGARGDYSTGRQVAPVAGGRAGKTINVTTHVYNPSGQPTEASINARAEMTARALLGDE